MIYPEKFSLKDKVAVVAGGSGLIGSQVSIALAEAGAKVYVAEPSEENVKKVVEKIVDFNGCAVFAALDITDDDSINSCVESIKKKEGKIDIWINGAYPRTSDWPDKFEDVKAESMRKNVDMQMNSCFVISQKVCEIMKEQKGGVLINFGSTYGVLGPNFSIYEGSKVTMPAAYAAIKGGVINFSRYLATYYAADNVRVNAICPGGVFDNQDPKFVEKYSKLTPLGRMAKPEEIAAPVLFLASDASSYMTGQVVMVDGGWSAW